MVKKIKADPYENQARDVITFVMALLYMQSVLTVANHTAMWVHNGSTHIVDPPSLFPLVVGLILIGHSWYKRKSMPSTLMLISLTIFATASLFWLSGLRTNF
jgi:hypothetical protein